MIAPHSHCHTDMEGKRAVSRSTQIAMEAFVPWVHQQLDDLLGIPREDERRETVMKVKAVMDLWIRYQLKGLLKLQNTVAVVKKAELESKLDPWIRHRLNDMLLAGMQEDDIVLGVKSELEGILVPRIKPQLNDLLEQRREGENEASAMNSVKDGLNRVLAPSIEKHFEDLLKKHREDEGRKMVLGVKARLEPVLEIAKSVLKNIDDERRKEVAVWEWVDKVMDVTYEAVDVLQACRSMSEPKVRRYLTKLFVTSRVMNPVISEYGPKIKEINAKLESLRKEADSCKYHVVLSYACPDDKFVRLTTSPEIDLYSVCCRKLVKKSVLDQLLLSPGNGEENGVKVISIVGCGGSGKTALAQFVYNDRRAQQHFKLRVWVSVSNVFDEKRVARDILLSVEKYKLQEKGEWDLIDEKKILGGIEKDEKSLFKLVEESFSGKLFLCVFDDVWTEYESSKWMRFASLLASGAPGSRILVTTRSERVARVVGSKLKWTHNLKPLSNQEWWLLWRERLALTERNRISKKIETTGSEIAVKCNGWSLVAVALARNLINNITAQGWECELNKLLEMGDEMWRVEGVAQELFRHFYSSYYKLSPTLKLCILYCMDFDKGTVIVVDQLVRMWMAQGYLGDPYNETDDAKTLKGLEYFHDLASWGFFQEFERGLVHKNKITSCKLDDTFHDFIRYEARHDLAALDQDKYTAVQEKRMGRHFHVASYGRVPQHLSVCGKHTKALVLSSFELEQVPSEIRYLSQLQYLDLSSNPLQELPEAICNLHSLQFLDVHQCYLLISLPRKIKKLRKLKHLRVDYTMDELHKHLPPGFEELTLIQTLDVFRTGGMYKDTIWKLKKLNDLRDICISVHGEVNFSDADLHRKPRLENLELCFVEGGRDQEKASKSVEELIPPGNLKMLKFENYPLKELPSWIVQHPLINKLTRLSLKSAWNITSFPALWKLLSLKFLWLYDIPNLKHIGREFLGLSDKLQLPEMQIQKTSDKEEKEEMDEGEEEEEEKEVVIDYIEEELEITVQAKKPVVFPTLKTLRIERMKNLELWEDLNEDEKMVNDITVMPSLEELIIDRCPKLLELPLCILADTPWFKITKLANSSRECSTQPTPEENETAIEIIEPIVLPLAEHSQEERNGFPDRPVTPSDKDPCMKLKDVLQAYRNRYLKDYIEVSIPKGVLGNVEVISCLSFKYLNEWFKPDGWVFAEQLCIWSKLVYELMAPADKKRVQMVSSGLITTIGRTEEQPDTRAEDLVNFMTNNEARLYLVPYLRPGHWELLAIVPEIGVTYRFDSLQRTVETELTGFLKMVERTYANRSPDSKKLLGSWRIVDIKHKKQTGYWECGYYVMIWMHKVAVNIQSLELEPHFPFDESPYEPSELKWLAQKWCAYVLPQFPV